MKLLTNHLHHAQNTSQPSPLTYGTITVAVLLLHFFILASILSIKSTTKPNVAMAPLHIEIIKITQAKTNPTKAPSQPAPIKKPNVTQTQKQTPPKPQPRSSTNIPAQPKAITQTPNPNLANPTMDNLPLQDKQVDAIHYDTPSTQKQHQDNPSDIKPSPITKQDNSDNISNDTKNQANQDTDNATSYHHQDNASIATDINQVSDKPKQEVGQNLALSQEKPEKSAPQEKPNQAIVNAWQTQVRLQIEQNLHYPTQALAKKWSGKPLLRITVNQSGQVLSATIAKSSGKPILDNEAIATAKRASPLPKPPEQLLQAGDLTVTIPINFNYKKHQ